MLDLNNRAESIDFNNQENDIKSLVKDIKYRLNNFRTDKIWDLKIKTFSQWEELYCKMLKNWRYGSSIPVLRSMCEKVSTESEKFKLKWYILSSMLMWIIKNNSKKDTIKSFSNMAKKLWFGPLSWITDIDHPEKVLNLLNWISEWDKKVEKLSDVVDSNIKDHMYSSPWWYDYWEFDSKFQQYWDKNWEKILKYIDNLETNIKGKE